MKLRRAPLCPRAERRLDETLTSAVQAGYCEDWLQLQSKALAPFHNDGRILFHGKTARQHYSTATHQKLSTDDFLAAGRYGSHADTHLAER